MMAEEIEQRVYDLVRLHNGVYIAGGYFLRQMALTPETDLDTDLNLDGGEAADLMNHYFMVFGLDRDNFSIDAYYPPNPPMSSFFNFFKKRECTTVTVPCITISMLIESVAAGHWLY
ncbi:uncharacterized protein DUF1493 [Serratia ficaria]|nr:DUF1493 family protein [Serratia ficaria]REF42074.1 uncharacterized protein DUF1493 [Serratia ficaria]